MVVILIQILVAHQINGKLPLYKTKIQFKNKNEKQKTTILYELFQNSIEKITETETKSTHLI
jgi:hypothetical protein